jgi:DNA polymerase-4
VQPHRETKSVGAEDTFPKDLITEEEMHAELDKLSLVVATRLQKHELKGRTITLKIKYSDFRQITRSQSLPEAIDDRKTIIETVKILLSSEDVERKPVRLLGISLSNFGETTHIRKEHDDEQLTLF